MKNSASIYGKQRIRIIFFLFHNVGICIMLCLSFLFQEKCGGLRGKGLGSIENYICFPTFYRAWRSEAKHIKLARNIGTHTTCSTCFTIKARRISGNLTEDELRKENLRRERHMQLQKAQKLKYEKHQEKARAKPDKYLSVVSDRRAPPTSFLSMT